MESREMIEGEFESQINDKELYERVKADQEATRELLARLKDELREG